MSPMLAGRSPWGQPEHDPTGDPGSAQSPRAPQHHTPGSRKPGLSSSPHLLLIEGCPWGTLGGWTPVAGLTLLDLSQRGCTG